MTATLPAAFDLSGRTAVVTGAGSPTGIGMACARLLRACGASVVVCATTDRVHDRVAELRDGGHLTPGDPGASGATGVAGVVADLTTQEGAAAVVAAALALGGSLDVLVNNAGMVSVAGGGDYLEGDLLGTPPERWSASLARNLDTAYLMTRAALPHLRASGAGRVVMVTSVTGPVMAMRSDVAYAAAKAGLAGLTRALAVDEGAHGVTVNAVAPGWIATGSQTASEAGGTEHPAGSLGDRRGGRGIRALPRLTRIRVRHRPGSRRRRREQHQRGAFTPDVNGPGQLILGPVRTSLGEASARSGDRHAASA